jgi:hypothetical protein
VECIELRSGGLHTSKRLIVACATAMIYILGPRIRDRAAKFVHNCTISRQVCIHAVRVHIGLKMEILPDLVVFALRCMRSIRQSFKFDKKILSHLISSPLIFNCLLGRVGPTTCLYCKEVSVLGFKTPCLFLTTVTLAQPFLVR